MLIVALALAVVALVAAASRPLGWVAAAAMVAALLQIPVAAVSRVMPRGLAVAVVLVVALGLVGGLAFGVVGDVGDQLDRLERAAPRAAGEIERSERFGEFATEVDLARRVTEFVDGLPDRLRGGDEVTAIRSAATRGDRLLRHARADRLPDGLGPDVWWLRAFARSPIPTDGSGCAPSSCRPMPGGGGTSC